ncbi:hypothetical protein TCAL_00817 [Tigriopus californicus]|uniref:C2H2-type domain-containing protein n=1 Tax=Tigriopus californicus TaxID=6832 RepID=A0A553NDE4_TIGCA|nr:zinc finger and BTB domain-containing protein 41-like [Tigriopus californicus]TRY63476.1 hypothetical protein TCAL_00817 [Tigriopus californicus]|eukprot:TCALIF_00817-PA protein Name:"Similar to ZNF782 Zinc finger protein 782 (Homo sapiens)" AED:0.00 eAED:0.00 QI:574/1/1/1/0.5/0.33/3/191/438
MLATDPLVCALHSQNVMLPDRLYFSNIESMSVQQPSSVTRSEPDSDFEYDFYSECSSPGGQISPLRANTPPSSPHLDSNPPSGEGTTAIAFQELPSTGPALSTDEPFLGSYILGFGDAEDIDEGLCLTLNFENSQRKPQVLSTKESSASELSLLLLSSASSSASQGETHRLAFNSSGKSSSASSSAAQSFSTVGEKTSVKSRQHACQYCEKLFKTRSNLNQHVRTHLGAIFKCDKCDKNFTESGYRYHLLTHRQEKPFSCHICAKSFVQNKLLQKHISSCHSEVRKFSCQHCPSSFKRKDHLSRHISDLHDAREKLFKCKFDECIAKFNSTRRLRVHERRHQERSRFHCEICPMKFLRKRQLTEHLKRKHACSDIRTDVETVLSKLQEDDDRAFDDFLGEILRADDELKTKNPPLSKAISMEIDLSTNPPNAGDIVVW